MQPKPWSFSALTDFTNCPKSYYHKRIAKDVADPPNEAGLWGDYVHKEFEKYLRFQALLSHEHYELPDDLAQYRDYLDAIVKVPGELLIERKYAITTQMQPCDFFAADVWCRAILDVLVLNGETAFLADHKTGKRRPTNQLKLSALIVFIHHPEVQVVNTAYFWLKDKKLDSEAYIRTNYEKMWSEFLPQLRPYMVAHQKETFVPRPSGLCNGWCPVTQCEHWKPKR